MIHYVMDVYGTYVHVKIRDVKDSKSALEGLKRFEFVPLDMK